MIKKYRTPLNVLFMFALLLGMMMNNFQAGKAQSDTDWTSLINISMSGIANNPVSVVDFKGTIHVIWIDEVDGYRYSRSANGVSWTTPEKVKFPFSVKDSTPVLLADPSGFIHMFWTDTKGEFHYAQSEARNFGEPSLWVSALLSTAAANYDVMVDAQGVMHLAYIENITDDKAIAGVYYRSSVAGAGFWNSPIRIYKSEYFRGTTPRDTYIRVTASNQPIGQKIYISWDNRPQKRAFLATSVDSGKTWPGAQQIKGPDDAGQYEAPFNASVWADAGNVLLMWQVGTPGASKCSVFSQWSQDGGKSWGETIPLFGGPTTCPTGIKYVVSQKGKVAVFLATTDNPMLLAWNGTQWSAVQAQASLPALSNPSTYDPILLGCRQDLLYEDTLFVVGCDQASGKDIWFLSRLLPPVDDWFTTSSIWTNPLIQNIDEQRVSLVTSALGADANIHVVWVETSTANDGTKPSIQYSLWDGVEWSGTEAIMWNLEGEPVQLTVNIDSQNRIMLAWIDDSNGDLLFSWANLDQANKSSEWQEASVVPSPSQINRSPDIVVDASGRITIIYAVPLNENRGIYLVQSTDNGLTWSTPQLVFNGVLAGWDVVDAPKITLSNDGTLHVLFSRQSLGTSGSVGMYYSQSQDGGLTWSDPQNVTESLVSWSDIVSYGDQTVHRLWQEDNGLVVANLSQVSQDGGVTWGKVLDVTDVSEKVFPVTLATNGGGQLSFIQLNIENFAGVDDRKLTLRDWNWDGSRWDPGVTREFILKDSVEYFVTAGITPENYLGVSLVVGYGNLPETIHSEVISLGRFREVNDDQGGNVTALIPVSTPLDTSVNSNPLPSASPVPTVDSAILFESNDPSEGMAKNLVGVVLIGITAIAAILLFRRRKPGTPK